MLKEILVIDDNPDIRSLVSNILIEQNYEVRTAANYDQAIFEINKKNQQSKFNEEFKQLVEKRIELTRKKLDLDNINQ